MTLAFGIHTKNDVGGMVEYKKQNYRNQDKKNISVSKLSRLPLTKCHTLLPTAASCLPPAVLLLLLLFVFLLLFLRMKTTRTDQGYTSMHGWNKKQTSPCMQARESGVQVKNKRQHTQPARRVWPCVARLPFEEKQEREIYPELTKYIGRHVWIHH